MVKFIYTVITLFFIFYGSCSAKTGDSTDVRKWFESGVELYKQGNFKQSALKFEKIIKSGTQSGALYFNLGNCYFKMGKLAKARVAYEKAKYFFPRDHELKGNLAYLLTKLEDKVQLPKENIFLKLYLSPSTFFTRNEISVILLIMFFMVIISWLLLIFRLPFRRIIIGKFIVFFMIFVWLSSVLYVKISRYNKADEAVVILKEIPVRWGNTDNDKVAFYLHEGTKVVIRQQRGNWFLITIGKDKTGWIKNNFVEVL